MWAALTIAACLVFAITSPVARVQRQSLNPWHHYEYLTEGFYQGHTYLSVDPPKDLLELKNPFLPTALPEKRLWDASLYRGKYYLYFGPAPSVVLMLPWKIISGQTMPQWVACSLWAIIGLIGLSMLLSEARDRYFPRVPPIGLGLVILVAFHASWLPVLLRRPAVWELPIIAAMACVWWSLYFLWRFHLSGGKARWALLLGTTLGVLIGCRVTFLFSAALILALLCIPTPGGNRRLRAWPVVKAGLLVSLSGLALLTYNYERFGRWTEFGTSFQLLGVDYTGARFVDARYILFNAWNYLLSLPTFSPYFPFVHPTWPGSFPKGHMGIEEFHGILFSMPVHAVALGTLFWGLRRIGSPDCRPLIVTLAGALGVTLLSAAILFTWGGLCSRYVAELTPGLTLLTAAGLLAVIDSRGSGRRARWVLLLCTAAALWTVAYTWLASADFKGYMKRTSPGAFCAVAHALDYPSLWQSQSHGYVFGPADLVIRIPTAAAAPWTPLMASGRPGMTNQLVLEQLGPARFRFTLVDDQHTTLVSREVAARGGVLRVHVEAPWLYPPAEHPYWDAVSDPKRRAELQSLFALGTEDGEVRAIWTHAPDPIEYEPTLLTEKAAPAGSAWVVSFSRSGDPALKERDKP